MRLEVGEREGEDKSDTCPHHQGVIVIYVDLKNITVFAKFCSVSLLFIGWLPFVLYLLYIYIRSMITGSESNVMFNKLNPLYDTSNILFLITDPQAVSRGSVYEHLCIGDQCTSERLLVSYWRYSRSTPGDVKLPSLTSPPAVINHVTHGIESSGLAAITGQSLHLHDNSNGPPCEQMFVSITVFLCYNHFFAF